MLEAPAFKYGYQGSSAHEYYGGGCLMLLNEGSDGVEESAVFVDCPVLVNEDHPIEHTAAEENEQVHQTGELARFWAKVVRGPLSADCWIWVGAIADDGYGRFYLEGASVRPHRYSLAHHLNIPHKVLPELMHECDIPLCVNPEHLALGDRHANMIDRERKRRASNGTGLRFRGLGRAAMTARSRALRQELLDHGWNAERLHAINADAGLDAPTLF